MSADRIKPATAGVRIRGPYSTDGQGVYVFAQGERHFMFAMMRGWGELHGLRGLSDKDAEGVQKANAQFMVDAMNEKEAREESPVKK
jgi:hypothetical protein